MICKKMYNEKKNRKKNSVTITITIVINNGLLDYRLAEQWKVSTYLRRVKVAAWCENFEKGIKKKEQH